MKTKIVYISGGEIFSQNEIKSALDEVRALMGYGDDVILFGMPVDAESVTAVAEPVKKTPRKKADKVEAPAEPAPAASPILSVISGMKEEAITNDQLPITNNDSEFEEEIEQSMTDLAEEIIIAEDSTADTPPRSIEDIFDDIAPLREDAVATFAARNVQESAAEPDIIDTDATLSKMAADFVALDTAEPIAETLPEPEKKPGKLGKIKNILPFKKAKKDETSVLGDLFGWAGVAAANDDADGLTPDFFTRAGSL